MIVELRCRGNSDTKSQHYEIFLWIRRKILETFEGELQRNRGYRNNFHLFRVEIDSVSQLAVQTLT